MDESRQKNITDEQERMARYAKALGHPVRVFIMDYLVKNASRCCYSGDMAEELPIARSTLSQHLNELKDAGLIQGTVNQPYIRYCIDPIKWNEAKQLLTVFFGREVKEPECE